MPLEEEKGQRRRMSSVIRPATTDDNAGQSDGLAVHAGSVTPEDHYRDQPGQARKHCLSAVDRPPLPARRRRAGHARSPAARQGGGFGRRRAPSWRRSRPAISPRRRRPTRRAPAPRWLTSTCSVRRLGGAPGPAGTKPCALTPARATVGGEGRAWTQ